MNTTPICSTDYMKDSLKFFNREQVYKWLDLCKQMDAVLDPLIQKHMPEIAANQNMVTAELANKFAETLSQHSIPLSYNLANFEAYHGYSVYAFTDSGEINTKSDNPDLYYGLAKATVFGVTHTHKLSDAFNYVIEGDGVFTGDPSDEGKFNNYYHGTPLLKDTAFEIPIGMTHGHLVKKDTDMWFLFVQECGFKPNLKCAGDFHVRDGYDTKQFGPYYI
jgi:hypothetical protein